MECTDIYCKVRARKRLKAQGYSENEAEDIANKTFDIVKKVMDNGKK